MLKTTKKLFLWGLIICGLPPKAMAQSQKGLSIDSCYALALRYYPLSKQYKLIEQTRDYSIQNVAKGYFPQLNIAGQASHQSAVTQIPISLPNLSIPSLSKDQYKLYGEISQPITDLFTLGTQKELLQNEALVDKQKVTIALLELKDRVQQLYFGILLIDEKIKQMNLLKADIQSSLEQVSAAYTNGTALKSDRSLLEVELLHIGQNIVELAANRQSYTEMLSLFIHQDISEETPLQEVPQIAVIQEINRPELGLYAQQKSQIKLQNKRITQKNLPHFSLFFQGGMGRPALNMLSNDVKAYYIGGLRLNWSISGFYTARADRKLLANRENTIAIQQEIFLFTTQLNLKQQNASISKYQSLLETDNDIVRLRTEISNTAKSQLAHGTITSKDYLNYIHATDQAKQDALLHQIQLLMAQYAHQTISGN